MSNDSVVKYIINMDEGNTAISKPILDSIHNVIGNQSVLFNFEDIEKEILAEMPTVVFNDPKIDVNHIDASSVYTGQQFIVGVMKDIPPIVQSNEIVFTPDMLSLNKVLTDSCITLSALLTGVSINQTGWKKEDTIDLKIFQYDVFNTLTSTSQVFYNMRLKEIPEHKGFESIYKPTIQNANKIDVHQEYDGVVLPTNDKIILYLNNNSGNSRQIFVEYELLVFPFATI